MPGPVIDVLIGVEFLRVADAPVVLGLLEQAGVAPAVGHERNDGHQRQRRVHARVVQPEPAQRAADEQYGQKLLTPSRRIPSHSTIARTTSPSHFG